MKSISNFIKSASEDAKRFAFLVGATTILVAISSLCSCSGNSKENSGNEDKSTDVVEHQATEPEKSEKEIAIENIQKAISRVSYSFARGDYTDDAKVNIDKDGYLNIIRHSKNYGETKFSFGIELGRYVYIDGTQIKYNPKLTADYFSPFVLKEVLFVLTEYSLRGDPMVRNRKDIDSSQYLYYLVFGNDDADDFVKERVQMHYDVALEQLLDEANNIYDVTNSGAGGRFTFKFEPSRYDLAYKISFYFDNDGYLVVDTSPWRLS